MNVMFKKAIDFAENLEGKATQDKIDEFHNLIRCVISEVENTAKVNSPGYATLAMKSEFELMVVQLLFKMLFAKERQNRTVELVINNLKS
jgi:hypothetical protein